MPWDRDLLLTEVRCDLLLPMGGAGSMVAMEEGGLVALVVSSVVFLMLGIDVVLLGVVEDLMVGFVPVLLDGDLVPCIVAGLMLLMVATDILALRRGRGGGLLLAFMEGALMRPGAAPLLVGWGLGFFLVELVEPDDTLAPRRGWRGGELLALGGLETLLTSPITSLHQQSFRGLQSFASLKEG